MYVSIEIPDISAFPGGFPKFWIKTVVGVVSNNEQIKALTITYVRLVEAALVEYRLGASRLREFWNDHSSFNVTAVNRSIAHFESCLSDMHRAANCYRRLRRHPARDPLCLALNQAKPLFVTERVAEQIRGMRDEIHHSERLLISGKTLPGQLVTLMPSGPELPHPTEAEQTIKHIDRLVIGGRELPFSDLSAWLTEMGLYAEKIAEF